MLGQKRNQRRGYKERNDSEISNSKIKNIVIKSMCVCVCV